MYLVKSMICNAYTEAFPMTSNLILAPIIRPKNGLFAVAFLPQKSGSAQKMYYHFCYKKSFFFKYYLGYAIKLRIQNIDF